MLERRFPTIRQGFASLQRLCETQFHATNPQQVIAPAKLHRLTQNNFWSLWKVELVIPNSGLKPNQWPRVWFAINGATIVFLCASSHADNYRDNDKQQLAISRARDFF